MLQRNAQFESRTPQQLLRGADLLADLVELTLGPSGRSVLIDAGGSAPLLGTDGYTVATHFDLLDPVRQSGVQALRNLAWEMLRDCGDGATTAVVLARAVLAGLVTMTAAGHDPQHLGQAVLRQAQAVAAQLRARAVPVEDAALLAAVATAACGADARLGHAVGEATHAVGASGLVLVEAGHGLDDELELRPGLHFASGWLSPAFATDEKLGRAVFEDAYVLVSNERIDRFDDILPVLEVFAQRKKPLVIIAREVRGEALATLVLNRRKADALVCAVAAPGEGDWKAMHLGDIAAATGATLLGDDSGHRLKDIKPAHIGRAGRIEIGRAETIIADGAADPAVLDARLAAIREQIAGARYLAFDREQHEQRLARLSGKLAMLRLGAPSALELERRRQAAKAAGAAARQARAGGAVDKEEGGVAERAEVDDLGGRVRAEGLHGQVEGPHRYADLRPRSNSCTTWANTACWSGDRASPVVSVKNRSNKSARPRRAISPATGPPGRFWGAVAVARAAYMTLGKTALSRSSGLGTGSSSSRSTHR